MRARVSRFLYSASYFFAVMMMLGQHHKKQSKNHERAEARHISYQLISFDPRTSQEFERQSFLNTQEDNWNFAHVGVVATSKLILKRK